MNDKTARNVMLAAAAAAAVGVLLPWATVGPLISVTGIEDIAGWLALAACVVGALTMLTGAAWWWQALLPLVAGGSAVGYALWQTSRDSTADLGIHLDVQVGSGVYLTTAAALVWWLVAMNTRETVAAAARAREAAEGAAA